MNGYELTRLLKSVRSDLNVIVMSGSGDIAAAVPDAAMLLKPFTLEELSRLIATQLQRSRKP
jgi:FixJ family two-component response regulator